MELFLAVIFSAAIVFYWVCCRKAGLAKQVQAVEAFEAYCEDSDNPESSAETLYRTYRFARHWAFMPLLSLTMPFVLLWSLFTKGSVLPDSSARTMGSQFGKTFSLIMDMYVRRHPITSFFSILLILLNVSLVMTMSFMLKKAQIKLDVTSAIIGMVSRLDRLVAQHSHK